MSVNSIHNDEDDEENCHNKVTNIIIIDSDDDREENKPVIWEIFHRKIRRFKYKLKRTLNIILRYYHTVHRLMRYTSYRKMR